MAYIKVIRGGCGIKYTDANGNARHALKMPEHGPFECDDVQADNLVRLGVAAYLTAPGVVDVYDETPGQDQPEQDQSEQDQPAGKIIGHLAVEMLEGMTVAQLKDLAADIDVDVSACKKKADYVAVIAAADVEVDDDAIVDDPDNELPDLTVDVPE